jgi:ParB/RepB/Spo0J family partition protein
MSTESEKLIDAPIEKIMRSPTQQRGEPEESYIEELAASIKANGLAQRILLRPLPKYTLHEPDLTTKEWRIVCNKEVVESWPGEVKISERAAQIRMEALNEFEYELVAGECRWRAFQLLKQKTIPAIVKAMSDKEAFGLQLAENLQRKNLNAMEEAKGYQTALDRFGYTVDELAEKVVKKSRSHVFSLLRLLKLDSKSQELVQKYKLPDSIAVLIPTVAEKQRAEVIQEIATRGQYNSELRKNECMTARRAKEWIAERYRQDLKHAKFDTEDKDLLPLVPSCEKCPKRTGNMALEGNPNVCTDPGCYQRKVTAGLNQKLDAAREKGLEVVPPSKSEQLFWYGNDLKSGCGYVKPGDAAPNDKKGRTFKQLVGDAVKPVVALDKHGSTVQLFKAEDVEKAFKDKGITMKIAARAEGGSDENYKEREAARKRKAAATAEIWKVALGQIRQKIQAGKTDPAFLRLLLTLDGDRWQLRELLKSWDMDEKDLAKANEGILRCMVLENIAMTGYGDDWGVEYNGELNRSAKGLVQHFGIDMKALSRAATEKEEPKAEPKKKAAKPKPAKKKGKKK